MTTATTVCTAFFALIFCIGCDQSYTSDGPNCSNPKYSLDYAFVYSSYLEKDLQNGIEHNISFVSKSVGSGAWNIYQTKEPGDGTYYSESYIWDGCGGNNLPDVTTLMLTGQRYVSSLDWGAASDIPLVKEYCQNEDITIQIGTFAAEHCRYRSKDDQYYFEIYRTPKRDESIMGGVLYYTGYENGHENYSFELLEWRTE